ncbi:hypothetical protein MGYG_07356 [Nannizzia gypsea CBS 118893]|uniref:Uncharacterized protein n=1 Tax=Arthroderma gypseum (strain ATCC MYA-4604 / CBS 118893) TaxID=535722 RepID=E4V2X4_ARTGP|nr:hypothetical protein MGYG_07356 [Nannizzia gypsea CBS 118893]EFR04348.1 hypothetical protein MGYG_07356 [Nannizzia gypsea CBS 118893]
MAFVLARKKTSRLEFEVTWPTLETSRDRQQKKKKKKKMMMMMIVMVKRIEEEKQKKEMDEGKGEGKRCHAWSQPCYLRSHIPIAETRRQPETPRTDRRRQEETDGRTDSPRWDRAEHNARDASEKKKRDEVCSLVLCAPPARWYPRRLARPSPCSSSQCWTDAGSAL